MLYNNARYSLFFTVNLHTKIIRDRTVRIPFINCRIFAIDSPICQPQLDQLIQDHLTQCMAFNSDRIFPTVIWNNHFCSIRTG